MQQIEIQNPQSKRWKTYNLIQWLCNNDGVIAVVSDPITNEINTIKLYNYRNTIIRLKTSDNHLKLPVEHS